MSTTPKTDSSTEAKLDFALRRSTDRGGAGPYWLNTKHTFSFANYYDAEFDHFHSLRVLNEDRVRPGHGFGKHSHSLYEIWSYVVSGALRHDDSLGNTEVLGRGAVQFTSTGTGIAHSEFNDSADDPVHFLQIWVRPSKSGLQPGYQTKHFSDQSKRNTLKLILSPDGRDDTVSIHQDLNVYASLLKSGQRVTLPVRSGRDYYVHVVQAATGFAKEKDDTVGLLVNGQQLHGGDGAFLRSKDSTAKSTDEALGVISFESNNTDKDREVEFLVFDIAKTSSDE